MEEKQDQDLQQPIIRQERSHPPKKTVLTATNSQTVLETPTSHDREKKQVALAELETECSTDITSSSANRSMTLIARKKVQEDILQRGGNTTYTNIPTDNPLESLTRIHTHQEKQMQGCSAYLEAKEEVGGKMLQEMGNETIHFSSATLSLEHSLEMKTPVPALPLSNIASIVSSEGIFPSPVKSNRLFARRIRNFLSSLDAVYKEDQDIRELCEEINVLIKDNITKEERDKIRGKIEEIYTIKKEMESNLASIKKNELNSFLATTLLEASASTNSLVLGSNNTQLPSYNSLPQEEKESESVANTFGMQNFSAVSKKATEARIHNQGTINQLNQLVGNTLFVLPPGPTAKSVQSPLKKVIVTAELTKTLQGIYQQNYAKLPRLFSEEMVAIADIFVNVAILKEEIVKEKESKLDAAQEKEDKQRDTKEIQDNRLQSHERLYEVHQPIAIGELFTPSSKALSPKKLLLYGRAGIGKTILCQYIAHQWSEKPRAKPDNMTCFRQFQAVFWVPLRYLLDRLEYRKKRNKPLNEEMMAAEMVTLCCLKGADWQKETQKQQLQIWLEENAERTLFILDGYDEIAETAATECELSDCLDAVLRQEQYKPYVLLTSRPIVIGSRYGSFDRRLECMGFIDENIPVFVKRYITDLQQSSNCLTFLKAHPSIWGTAHIPLNLELICWLWSKGELSVDNSCYTMAALYSQITTKMKEMNMEERKHPSLSAKWQYVNDPFSETTVADFAEEFLPFLGFHAMQQSGVLLKGKYIQQLLGIFIKAKDIYQQEGTIFEEKQRKLLQACVDFSFLKPTHQGGKHLFDHTYYFIHLSFQEFFAAKYYQQAFVHADVAVIQHFQAHKYTPSYQLTWWMSAGLLYQQKNIAGLETFLLTLYTSLLDLIGIHHMNLLSHCLDECQADEKIDVVARFIQHLAGFLKHLLTKEWLAEAWSKTLLHCPNLLRTTSFQDAGLYLWKEIKQNTYLPTKGVFILSHFVIQTAASFPYFIACLKDTTEDDWVHTVLASALAERPDISSEQIQTLFDFVKDTTLDHRVRRKFASTLVERRGLLSEQVQTLIDFVKDTTLDDLDHWPAHIVLAGALAKHSDLSPEQIQSLFDFIKDTILVSGVHPGLASVLASVLAKRLDLPSEQVQTLFDSVKDTMLATSIRAGFASALAERSDISPEHVKMLIDFVKDTTLAHIVRSKLASTLAERRDLSPEQVQILIDSVKDNTPDRWVCKELASGLAKRPDLSLAQIQILIDFIEDTALDNGARAVIAIALAGRPDLSSEQVQMLINFVKDTTLSKWLYAKSARALAFRSDLPLEHIQTLFNFVKDTMIDEAIRQEIATALAQNFAQYASFPVEQLQQLLAYILKGKIICKRNPELIFQVLLVYCSNSQINQLQPTVYSNLCEFLTSSSAWFELTKRQALLVYNELSRTVQLHLQEQMIEFVVKKKFYSRFFERTCKNWGENLYQDVLRVKRTKFSLWNLATRKNKMQASPEQSLSVRYIAEEKKRINQFHIIRRRKSSDSVRKECLEMEEESSQKATDCSALQTAEQIRLSDQVTKIVTTTTSTTMMSSRTVMTVKPIHHKLYKTTVLPDTGNTLWADIDVPADNTCLFYAVALGALLPVLEEIEEFARCFRALFGEDKEEEAISQLQNCLKSFDGSPYFIQHHSAQLEVLVNVALRQQVVHVMRQNPPLYQEKLALENEMDLVTKDEYEHYLQNMANPKDSWGGLIEIGVMSQLLNIPILTYEQEGFNFVPKDALSGNQGKVIRIVLTKASSLAAQNNHFHVLLKPKHILAKTSNRGASYLDNKSLEPYVLSSQNTFFNKQNPTTYSNFSTPQFSQK